MRWRERGLRLLTLPSLRAQRSCGRLRLSGLIEGADIRRDERGVPFVTAAEERDLYFAVGYAQATDRLWQMDVLRRRANGRLAEIFGAVVVEEDVRARKLALGRVARRSEALLSTEHRANLVAFSDGVNAAVRRMRRRGGLPVEFVLLRYRPEPWIPQDSIAIIKHLGFDLGRNLANEAFRARLAQERPEYAAAFTTPKYPADGPVTIRTASAVPVKETPTTGAGADAPSPADLPPPSRAWFDALLRGERPLGSNAWVVSGGRTASGSPLLANDPHIVLTQPSLWYQMGLRLDDEAAATGSTGYGVTVPGLPGLIAGANRHLAWGITNSTVDTQDLCMLPPDADSDEAWTEESVITVRGAEPVRVRAAGGARHVELDPPGSGGGGRYGLFWSGLEPSVEIEACQRMWRARDYPQLRDTLRTFGVPVLNVVVACQDGSIALKTAGNVPARVPGSSGNVPGRYAEVARSWEDFLSFDALPEVVDPVEGYIVSANHRLLPVDAPLDVGVDWLPPYRAERIEELITTEGSVTAAACARWQSDLLNGRARRVLPTLLDALDREPPETPLAVSCRRLLAEWDGHDQGHLAAPLVFFRLMQVLAEHWIGSRLGEELAAAMPDVSLQVDHLVLTPEARAALGDRERLSVVVRRALTETSRRIAGELGEDPSQWRYDQVHRITDQHPLGRAVPTLALLFGAPSTPAGGSSHSVGLASSAPKGGVVDGAPWRFVAELSPSEPGLWDVLRHGASGNPASRHYDDQTLTHTEGRHHRVDLRAFPDALPTLFRLRPR
ncbi:penicillin acylase family protein [Streptomyces sp. NBC_00280]|uniref:penicillin acylase family protein n=1 Tax=Streptomyces sp. NBC_00280 TaxID=2975699 RepID=UPI003246AB39